MPSPKSSGGRTNKFNSSKYERFSAPLVDLIARFSKLELLSIYYDIKRYSAVHVYYWKLKAKVLCKEPHLIWCFINSSYMFPGQYQFLTGIIKINLYLAVDSKMLMIVVIIYSLDTLVKVMKTRNHLYLYYLV